MTARVVSVSGTRVTLIPAESACFGCMRGDCEKKPAPLIIESPGDPVPAPGQLVETGISPGALVREILGSLLLPALAFVAGGFLAGRLFPRADEGARAAAGLLFLFLSALVLYLIRRRFPPKAVLRLVNFR
ncbi:MAG: SoxR reducing system RseC family protein [Treponema sp.]|jgi:positive regulator of sigma E activity|nr:SoxR reducing system RseC family protein [Treponema sp.]